MREKTIREISIKLGEEHKIRVENIESFNNSIFHDIYKDAFKCIASIVKQNNKCTFERKYIDNNRKNYDDEEDNNIIAFLGDRGTGKTSAMKSVAKILDEGDAWEKNNEFLGDIENASCFDKVHFHVLKSIDPSMLEDNDSIIDVIVAEMFSEFKDKLKSPNSFNNMNSKKELLQKFSDVYNSMRVINTDKKNRFGEIGNTENVINTLDKLSSSSRMKNTFEQLVDNYLKFINEINRKDYTNNYMVITIDDLDMKLNSSSEICEQIRKYIMVPNVIILISSRFEQLRDLIEKSYIESFGVVLKQKQILSEDTKEMAEKYLEKLIPDDRRLFLPTINDIDDYEVNSTEIKIYNNENKKDEDFNKEYENLNIEEFTLKLLHEKTGLLFLKQDQGVHPLVPQSLRELNNFIPMLFNMKPLKNTYDDINNKNINTNINIANIDKFERYFINNWITRNVDNKDLNIISKFLDTNIEYKNKFIVNLLSNRLEKFIFDENKNNNILQDSYKVDKGRIYLISNLNNEPFNISLGDVLYVLNLYEKYFNEYKLTFSIKTLYSIQLYRLIKLESNNDFAKYLIGGDIFGEYTKEFIRGERSGFKILDLNEVREKYADDIQLCLFYFMHLGSIYNERRISKSRYFEIEFASPLKIGYFNIMAFVFYLLDENIEKRVGIKTKTLLKTEIEKWVTKYNNNNCIIPLYSMDFIEKFRKEIIIIKDKKFKNTLNTYYDYLEEFFTSVFKTAIENISYKNRYLELDEFLINFKECPLLKFMFDNKKSNEVKEIGEVINSLFNKSSEVTNNLKVSKQLYFELDSLLSKYKKMFGGYKRKIPIQLNTIIKNINKLISNYMNKIDCIKNKEFIEKLENDKFCDSIEKLEKSIELNFNNNNNKLVQVYIVELLDIIKNQQKRLKDLYEDEKKDR